MLTAYDGQEALMRPFSIIDSGWLPESDGTTHQIMDPIAWHCHYGMVLPGPVVSAFQASGYAAHEMPNQHLITAGPPQRALTMPFEMSPFLSALAFATNGLGDVTGENPVTHYDVRGKIYTMGMTTHYFSGGDEVRRQQTPYAYSMLSGPSYRRAPFEGYTYNPSIGGSLPVIIPAGQGSYPGTAPFSIFGFHNWSDVFGTVLNSLSIKPSTGWFRHGPGNYWTRIRINNASLTSNYTMISDAWKEMWTYTYEYVLSVEHDDGSTAERVIRNTRRIWVRRDLYEDYGIWAEPGIVSISGTLRKMLVYRVDLDRDLISETSNGSLTGFFGSDPTQVFSGSEIIPNLYWWASSSGSSPSTAEAARIFIFRDGSRYNEIKSDFVDYMHSDAARTDRYFAFANSYAAMAPSLSTNFIETVLELSELSKALPDLTHLLLALKELKRRPWMAAKEMVDFLTGSHLWLQYGLIPNVSAVSEVTRLHEVLLQPIAMGTRFHGSQTRAMNLHGIPCLVTTRCRTRLRDNFYVHAYLSAVTGLARAGLFPTISNLWDLIPLSFVADWFTGISAKIRRFEDAATLAVLPTLNYVLIHEVTMIGEVPPGFSVLTENVIRLFNRGVFITPPPPVSFESGPGAPSPIAGSLIYQLIG